MPAGQLPKAQTTLQKHQAQLAGCGKNQRTLDISLGQANNKTGVDLFVRYKTTPYKRITLLS